MVNTVEEVDAYTTSIGGVEVLGVRTGRGFGPNTVLSTRNDELFANSVTMRFPMANRSTIGDSTVLAASVSASPAGTRWIGSEIQPGMVVIYGPGSEHTATNPAGLRFSFVTCDVSELAALADTLELELKPPPRGQAHILPSSTGTAAFTRHLSGLVDSAAAGIDPDTTSENDVLTALANALSTNERIARVGSRRRIDDRHVVNACIEYAEAVGRVPTVRELCLVSHVSERRLRHAFTETYNTPPIRFFRTWGLNKARARLAAANSSDDTVTATARDLGFAHLGRFAGRYKALFGESPAATLGTFG